MAESHYGRNTFPGGPAPQHQEQETDVSMYPQHPTNPTGSFRTPLFSPVNNAPQFRSQQLPEPSGQRSAYSQHSQHQRWNFDVPPAGLLPPSGGMFHHSQSGPMTPGPMPNYYFDASWYGTGFEQDRNANDSGGMLDFDWPAYGPLAHPPWVHAPSGLTHHPLSQVQAANPPTLGQFGVDAAPSMNDNHGSRRADSRTAELPHDSMSPNRRAAIPVHNQQESMEQGMPERRPLPRLVGMPVSRQDRSLSPRTPNRRSFDRYSTDLSRVNSSSESNDTRSPMSRARRQRVGMPPGLRARMLAHYDPNVPSAAQMQALKDKLRHFLPSELPNDTSTVCDICDKDYSTTYVQPSEEDEVAIQLPCKHFFGEYCINKWFETCKTFKNKVTCPVCRKLLVEPTRPWEGMLPLLQNRQILERMQRDERFRDSLDMRHLEGDFGHP